MDASCEMRVNSGSARTRRISETLSAQRSPNAMRASGNSATWHLWWPTWNDRQNRLTRRPARKQLYNLFYFAFLVRTTKNRQHVRLQLIYPHKLRPWSRDLPRSRDVKEKSEWMRFHISASSDEEATSIMNGTLGPKQDSGITQLRRSEGWAQHHCFQLPLASTITAR